MASRSQIKQSEIPNIIDIDARAKDLIDVDDGLWNVTMVKEIFNEEEAERICSMAISPNRQIDQLIWIGM
jgi:uncharacterized protein (UPF0216 family)